MRYVVSLSHTHELRKQRIEFILKYADFSIRREFENECFCGTAGQHGPDKVRLPEQGGACRVTGSVGFYQGRRGSMSKSWIARLLPIALQRPLAGGLRHGFVWLAGTGSNHRPSD
jgi:hypothetical protein